MGLILKMLIYLCLCAGVLCVHEMSELPCQFTEEHVFLNKTNHTYREATLQFGQKGDAPINPHAITFLVTASKLDLRRYVKGVEADELERELRRYSTEGIHVRWPVQGAQEYNHWFSYTLKHSKGRFTVTGFLRHPTDQPLSGQQDYRSWPAIGDRDILTTTVVMVIKTETPSVKAGLGSQQKLHCQFAVDHKGPNLTVEWHRHHRGERTRLFSHNSLSGQKQRTGVGLMSLAGGDASYTVPFTKMTSEGTYICSVSVSPLFALLDMKLHVEEPPHVSINVERVLSLQEGEEKKVVCDAKFYYPLDVDIDWYEQNPTEKGEVRHIHLQPHRENNSNKTYFTSAFFYLKASLNESGKQFTCFVSHQSLRVPIKKSFILNVQGPSSLKFILTVSTAVVTMFILLYYLHTARKKSVQKKLY
uniref:tapasin-related protein-like n=1 Tax=Monopterus albus TaxID=43700 RepID=UPI0009B4C1B1|nr:tapasin-related protein-like [Monopterus albus]